MTYDELVTNLDSMLTTKEEYCGIVNARLEEIWIHQILGELGFPVQTSTTLYCDNHSMFQVIENHVSHNKMKHVKLHTYYLR
jgi:hypothetical protein